MSSGDHHNKSSRSSSLGKKRTGYDPSRLILDTATTAGVGIVGSSSSSSVPSSSTSSSSSSSSSKSSGRLGSLRPTPDLSLSSTVDATRSGVGRESARFRPNVARATATGPTRFMPNLPSDSSTGDAAGGRRGSQQRDSRESKFRPNVRGAKSRRGGSSSRGGHHTVPLSSLASGSGGGGGGGGGGLMTQQFLGSMGLAADTLADVPTSRMPMRDDVKDENHLLDQKMNVDEHRFDNVRRATSQHDAFADTKVPPRIVPAPGSLEETIFDTATSSSNSVQAMQLDEAEARATHNLFRYNIERLMSDDQLFFIQLPSSLPVAESRKKTEAGKGKKDGKTAMSKDEEYESIWTTQFESTLTKVPAGYMGEMVVRKSGKTKLILGSGDSQLVMDVLPGSDFTFLEHVVAISTENAQSYVLGEVAKRMTVVPSIEDLLLEGKK